jgi:cytochrome c-type protein NapB
VPGSAALRPDPRAVENDFDGLDAPGAGPRASIVAPPQLPHRVFMRENCDSCHGVNGRDPIRSSHPWRESCSQCHASSSDSFPGLAP